MGKEPTSQLVGNGLLPDSTRPLPEPVLIIIKGGLWLSFESNFSLLMNIICNVISEIARLTHWGRVTHICVCNLTIIGWNNGLSPGRRQAIIWTNAGIGSLGTNSEILIEIHALSFEKMHLKRSSAKWRPFCLGLNVLKHLTHPLHRSELCILQIVGRVVTEPGCAK